MVDGHYEKICDVCGTLYEESTHEDVYKETIWTTCNYCQIKIKKKQPVNTTITTG